MFHIVGHHPGSVAGTTAVADLLDGMHDGLLRHLPDLHAALGDYTGITYTQWEAFLALHHRVPMLVYAPADARHGQAQALTDTFAQRIHVERLAVANKRPEYCADEAEFVGKILADVHRHFGIEAPTAAPRIALLRWVARIPDDFDAYFRALWAAGYGKEQIPAAEVDTLEKKVRALMGDSSRVMDKLPDMFEQTAPSPQEQVCFAEVFPAFRRECAACFEASRHLMSGISVPVEGGESYRVPIQMLYSALEVQNHLRILRLCAEELVNQFPVDDVEAARRNEPDPSDR